MPEDAAILAGLHGLREAAPVWPDVAAALAAGLVLTTVPWLVLSLFQARPSRPDIRARIIGARLLPDAERAAALAGLLREMTDGAAPGEAPWATRAAMRFGLDRDRLDRLREELYRPAGPADIEELEATVVRVAELAGR